MATFRPSPPAAGEREPASPAASSTPSHAKLVSRYCTPCKIFRDTRYHTRPARHPRFPPTHLSPARPPAPRLTKGQPPYVCLSSQKGRSRLRTTLTSNSKRAHRTRLDTIRRDRKPSRRASSSRTRLSPPFLRPHPPPEPLRHTLPPEPKSDIQRSTLHVQNSHRTPDPAQQSAPTPQTTSTSMATRTPRPDAPPDPNPHPAPHPRLELPVPPNRSRGPQSNRPQPLPYLQHTIPLPHRTAPQPHAEGPSHRDLRERCAARIGGRQATPVSLQSMSPILLSSLCRSRQSSQPKDGGAKWTPRFKNNENNKHQ